MTAYSGVVCKTAYISVFWSSIILDYYVIKQSDGKTKSLDCVFIDWCMSISISITDLFTHSLTLISYIDPFRHTCSIFLYRLIYWECSNYLISGNKFRIDKKDILILPYIYMYVYYFLDMGIAIEWLDLTRILRTPYLYYIKHNSQNPTCKLVWSELRSYLEMVLVLIGNWFRSSGPARWKVKKRENLSGMIFIIITWR